MIIFTINKNNQDTNILTQDFWICKLRKMTKIWNN